MKVSIISPVYNVEKYIERCFESISQQTYSNHLIECIFVDDCGSDNSIRIVQQLIEDYNGDIHFKLIHHEKNKGLSEARNSGTLIAKGEYLYYFDSDDEITEDCIETLISLADKYENADIIMGSSDTIRESEHINSYIIKDEIPEYSDDKLWLKRSLLKRTYFPITAWNKLVKQSFLKKHKLFFKPGIIHEDKHWQFFVAKHITSAAFCKKITYKHYINEGSIITTISPKQVESLLIIVEDFLINIDDVLEKEQYKTIYYIAFYALIRSLDNHDKTFVQHVMNRLKHLFKQRLKDATSKFKLIELQVLLIYSLPTYCLGIFKSKLIRTLYYGLLKTL